ncbi:MAG TPA: hypothetical protein VJO14_07385 [Bacteroidota bacterium]|nr:hypothetical protein [Bacteroidota bacterium]
MNRTSSSSSGRTRPVNNGPDLPRIIVWHITGAAGDDRATPPSGKAAPGSEPLNMSESMLVIDSIARTAKPIVVLSGEEILGRLPRLAEMLEYGRALGLKMIVEVSPEELTDGVLKAFIHFGERIFRVRIGEALGRQPDTRGDNSPLFGKLEACLDRIERAGYETHLVYTATEPDLRKLALMHDYALRRSARGLYYHLRFDLDDGTRRADGEEVDDFIKRFATMKEYSPSTMIISPQCVRFVHTSRRRPHQGAGLVSNHPEWEYTCVAGKSYAYIDRTGAVRLCGGQPGAGISLRETGYDFRKIWFLSAGFTGARASCTHCLHGYHSLSPAGEVDRFPDRDEAPAPPI